MRKIYSLKNKYFSLVCVTLASSFWVGPVYAQEERAAQVEKLRVTSHTGILPAEGKLYPQTTLMQTPGFPAPTMHTQKAYPVEGGFTARWTRADALQIKAASNPNAAFRKSSLPKQWTMPNVPEDFPTTNPDVWIWDTWTLIDKTAHQFSYNGWEVIFALVADRNAGFEFEQRHWHARIGYFYRRANIKTNRRPSNGGWIYGGHLIPEGSQDKLYLPGSYNALSQWSGSSRLIDAKDNKVSLFYTSMAFNRDSNGNYTTAPNAIIVQSIGNIHADFNHVWFTGFTNHTPLLTPDGLMYQNGQQNKLFNFRDPFTFEDPKHPGKNYMLFEGNSPRPANSASCSEADLGFRPGEQNGEALKTVLASGAAYSRASIGLAVADNKDLSKWHFLKPIITANCVNDQTERPQLYLKDGKYYIFTISHRTTYAPGVDGPDGLYGFVGDGIRSDFAPLNGGGLVIGTPTNLNVLQGSDDNPYFLQDPHAFQSYAAYVMPNGLIESFIQSVGSRMGGSLAPTVRININAAEATTDYSYGNKGIGGYGDISANEADINQIRFYQDLMSKGIKIDDEVLQKTKNFLGIVY
ncbi:glycoside hydrolase family 68 protein [Asaia sp. HN010]|uniref:glycoside hydrolase family 68 protein n=1 Tax=Asaia sp. HN010 TaxID=3081233 RepID=UPI003018E81E